MSNLNKVMLIGRLGSDPEVRTSDNGKSVARISLATTESYKDKQSGERKENTSWHRVVLFDQKAKLAEEYLEKGSLVYIEGKLRYGKYEKDGQTHYTTDIVATELRFLPSNSGNHDQQQTQRRKPEPAKDFEQEFADDDIPF